MQRFTRSSSSSESHGTGSGSPGPLGPGAPSSSSAGGVTLDDVAQERVDVRGHRCDAAHRCLRARSCSGWLSQYSLAMASAFSGLAAFQRRTRAATIRGLRTWCAWCRRSYTCGTRRISRCTRRCEGRSLLSASGRPQAEQSFKPCSYSRSRRSRSAWVILPLVSPFSKIGKVVPTCTDVVAGRNRFFVDSSSAIPVAVCRQHYVAVKRGRAGVLPPTPWRGSHAVLVAPAATTPRDAHGLGTSDGDWRSFYDGVLQHLPKRMETNEGPQPRSRREAPDFWEPESWGLTHRGCGAANRRKFLQHDRGQAVAVGVSLTLLVVIAVAVAVLAWRRKVLERHRTPSDRYRHAADDLRQLHDQIERDSDRRRDRRQRGSSGGSGI